MPSLREIVKDPNYDAIAILNVAALRDVVVRLERIANSVQDIEFAVNKPSEGA